jgi:DNA end-binding protein Ku
VLVHFADAPVAASGGASPHGIEGRTAAMAARAISSATISFGLVSIPIKVYTASSSKTVHFSMLHDKDNSRLSQGYTCKKCEEPVSRNDTVRGYEYARNRYVVMTEDELKALEKQSDRTIEIEEFIPIEQVDPLYFEKSNLLGPDKGGNKAYRLLRRAMTDSGKVAIGRYNTRGRQQLVLIRPTAEGLILHGLHYADEVRSFADIEFGDDIELKDGELGLASQLIDQLSESTFAPEKYEDEYRKSILEAVDRKVAGEEIVVAPAAEPKEQIIDLVAALKQSLAEKGGRAAPAKAKKAAAKPAVKAKKKTTKRKAASG